MFGPEEGERLQSDLGEEVVLGGMGLMEEEPEVEAVDIDEDGLLLAGVAVVGSGELQVSVLIEAFLLLRSGDVVEDIDLRADFAVVGHQLDFSDVGHPVELKSYLLRVRAEAPRAPPLRPREEQRAHWVLGLLGTAGNYLEFQLAAHLYNWF